MITQGSKVLNLKTETIHIVDGIEIINNEKLIFTKDVKCFPYEEVKLYNNVDEVQEAFYLALKSISEGRMKYDGYAMPDGYIIPDSISKIKTKKNIFQKIYNRIFS
jgi:hypothetical protein